MTLFGSTTPRVWTPPLAVGPPGPCGCGCALTPESSLGFAVINFCSDVLEVDLFPWQRWLFIHALETVVRDGRRAFRYRTILIMIARQNGKTTWIEFKNLWKMLVAGARLVIGTAQNLDTAEESWQSALDLIKASEELADQLESESHGGGKKVFKLVSGARWKIAPSSRGGGRGLSGDDVNLDELREHLDWTAWGAITKTTMARPNAQVWAFSNAGDLRSIVLNSVQKQGRSTARQLRELQARYASAEDVRREALAAEVDLSRGHFEWSVPDDVKCTCGRQDNDPHRSTCRMADRALWAQANPSLGYGTLTESAILSALNTDPDEIFLTEVLCQRVPSLKADRVIDPALWSSLAVAPEQPGDVALAVGINRHRTHGVIAACGPRADGRLQVAILAYRPGTDWIVPEVMDIAERVFPIGIAVQDKGPTATLVTPLKDEGLEPPDRPEEPERGDMAIPWASDVATAYGMFVDAVRQGTVTHVDDKPLNVAVAEGVPRSLGTGSAWEYRIDADVSPLDAVTLAHWLYVTWSPLVRAVRDEIGVF